MTHLQLAVFATACLLIGLSKGGLGGPLPVSFVIPIVVTVMDDATQAIALMLPFLIFGDWFAMRAYWNQWDMHYVRLMLPMGVIGTICAGALLSVISERGLKIFIGIIMIIVILYKLLSDRLDSIDYKPKKWHGHLAGWVSAFASTLSSTGGPAFTIYMLLQKVEPIPFIATTTLFFTIINVLKIPIFLYKELLDFNQFMSVIWLLPILPIGVWLGRWSLNYVSQTVFERIMMVLLALSIIFLFTTL